MINHISVLELGAIAARGGSLEIDASQYSALELGGIAAQLSDGATLKINNCSKFSALELGGIVARKPGQVILC
ncbi:hypothetical protein [Phaeobacter inhibens]|uniref:hypothetical protein n=1 Tax=Phaeobacter inhibens TaxID=221822 RepID=UPI002491D161|nr:hypothetical protein [Phaeobacter inhibens]